MDYPSQLPCPLRAGYGFTPENNIIRSQMVSGRSRQRVQYTSVPTYNTLSWLLTAVESQLFESWSVAVGADWFTIKLKTPLGYYLQECRFTETPKGPELVGVDLWSYSANVEVRDRSVIDDSFLLLPGMVLMQDIFDIAMNEKWPE